MRRIASLLGKELRQHGLFVALLFFVIAPVQGVILTATAFAPSSVSLFEAHKMFLWAMVPIIGLVVGNRLIVSEHSQRTQLFLEALPLRRTEVVILKYVLGLVIIAIATMVALAASVAVAMFKEPVDAWFAVILATRSLGWVIGVWGFLFAMGFTGRLRLAIYIGGVLLLVALQSFTGAEVGRFGLFATVNVTLPYEREVLPWADVLVAVAVGALGVAIGLTLSLVNEGSLAEALARRMSVREKSAIGAMLLVAFAVVGTASGKPDPAPFTFPEGTPIVTAASLPITVAYHDEAYEARARALASSLERDLRGLPPLLGWDALPPVRISTSEQLDGRTFDIVELGEGDGALVRAGIGLEDLDDVGLLATVVRATLLAHTNDRAGFEPRAWFLDGFARHYAESCREADGRAEGRAPTDARALSLGRALFAARSVEVDADTIRHWYRTRERLGPLVAEGFARSGVDALEAIAGRDAPAEIARRLFDEAPPDDGRAVFEGRAKDPATLIPEVTGLDYREFLARWRAHLASLASAPWAADSVGIPTLEASISVVPVEGELRAVEGTVTAGGAPEQDAVLALLHHRLTPFDLPLVELEHERRETIWPAGATSATVRLEGAYGPGERAFFAVEVESDVLDCPLRLAAERRSVE